LRAGEQGKNHHAKNKKVLRCQTVEPLNRQINKPPQRRADAIM
jgi:hypothetical protein